MDQQELTVNTTAQEDTQPEVTEQAQETAAPVAEQQETAPAESQEEKHEESMQELLDQYGSTVRLRKGQILTGTVVGKNEAGWLVNVGFKCEGVLPEKEYTNHALIETGPEPKAGDTIEVEVVSVRDGEEAQLL
ncbi:MAG: S1 RNA-binding domain-containing protein, partial [Synergistaceae bacterium]|nr:S1 RNA-binding domain-containing protein [Synergistaceae bacterium]